MIEIFYSMRFKVVTCHMSDGATAIQLGYVLRLPHKEYVVVQQPLKERLDCAGVIRRFWPLDQSASASMT